jgi:hypothetical protein
MVISEPSAGQHARFLGEGAFKIEESSTVTFGHHANSWSHQALTPPQVL